MRYAQAAPHLDPGHASAILAVRIIGGALRGPVAATVALVMTILVVSFAQAAEPSPLPTDSDAAFRTALFEPVGGVALTPIERRTFMRVFDDPGFLGATVRRRLRSRVARAGYDAENATARAASLRKVFAEPPTGGTTGIAFQGVPTETPYRLDPEHAEGKGYVTVMHREGGSDVRITCNRPSLDDVGILAKSLEALPEQLSQLVHTIAILRVPERPHGWQGLSAWNGTINEYGSGSIGTWADEGLRHEIGHIVDSSVGVSRTWPRAIAADAFPVSTYGNSNSYEDFAEFMRLYLNSRGNADRLASVRAVYPNRYAFLQSALSKLGLTEAP